MLISRRRHSHAKAVSEIRSISIAVHTTTIVIDRRASFLLVSTTNPTVSGFWHSSLSCGISGLWSSWKGGPRTVQIGQAVFAMVHQHVFGYGSETSHGSLPFFPVWLSCRTIAQIDGRDPKKYCDISPSLRSIYSLTARGRFNSTPLLPNYFTVPAGDTQVTHT